MAILRPLLAETGAEPVGKVVIGTVKGDIHDIGKNLVAMMLEGAGFEVFDLGINTDADKFLAALEQHKPDILGMSALLTTTMPYMKVVIETLKERGHPRRLHRARRRRAAERGVRRRRSAPTPTAATPRSPPRRPARSSTSAVPASPEPLGDRRRTGAAAARPRHRLRRAGPRARRARPPAGLPSVDLDLPAGDLHNRPERIPAAVRARIRGARADGYDRIFVAYADCGTGGLLDRGPRATRASSASPGAHCYEVYAGRAAFAALADAEPGTFYLTDFLARNFDRLVIRGLGLDRHPELLPIYFGNYRRRRLPRPDRRPGADSPRPARAADASASPSSGARPASASWRRRSRRSAAASPRPAGDRGRLMAGTLTVIWWRDIPAQVIARDGRQATRSSSTRGSRSPSTGPPVEGRQARLQRLHRGVAQVASGLRRRARGRGHGRGRPASRPSTTSTASRAHPVRRPRRRPGPAAGTRRRDARRRRSTPTPSSARRPARSSSASTGRSSIIGERINPTGRKLLAEEMKARRLQPGRARRARPGRGRRPHARRQRRHPARRRAGDPGPDDPARAVAGRRAALDRLLDRRGARGRPRRLPGQGARQLA